MACIQQLFCFSKWRSRFWTINIVFRGPPDQSSWVIWSLIFPNFVFWHNAMFESIWCYNSKYKVKYGDEMIWFSSHQWFCRSFSIGQFDVKFYISHVSSEKSLLFKNLETGKLDLLLLHSDHSNGTHVAGTPWMPFVCLGEDIYVAFESFCFINK